MENWTSKQVFLYPFHTSTLNLFIVSEHLFLFPNFLKKNMPNFFEKNYLQKGGGGGNDFSRKCTPLLKQMEEFEKF